MLRELKPDGWGVLWDLGVVRPPFLDLALVPPLILAILLPGPWSSFLDIGSGYGKARPPPASLPPPPPPPVRDGKEPDRPRCPRAHRCRSSSTSACSPACTPLSASSASTRATPSAFPAAAAPPAA